MTNREPIAHLSDDGRSQPVYDHLIGTGSRAEKMAAEFGCGEWVRLANYKSDLITEIS